MYRCRAFGTIKETYRSANRSATSLATALRIYAPAAGHWPSGWRLAFGGLLRRMMQETTLLFRLGVVAAIAALVVVTYQQNRLNVQLQQRIEQDASRLDSVSRALVRARKEALTPNDLKALRRDIGNRIRSYADRLKALEYRSEATARVITETLPAVVFLQGAYGFRDISSI